MIGLDSNVLVRYLMQDDPAQATRASDLIERHLTDAQPGFVNVVVLAEVVWVLDRAYGLRPNEIAKAVERLLQAKTLLLEHEQQVFVAMAVLKKGLGSFGDALIGALGTKAGCIYTLTFDRKALRLPGFRKA